MSKSRSFVSVAVLGVLVLGVIFAASSCKPKAKEPPQAPPVENLFAVQVNNFQYTLSQIDQFLVGVSPVPMGLQMLVRMQLAGVLGSPELAGVNMNASFAAFGVLMPAESPEAKPASRMFLAGLLPVTDYDKLVGGNPKFSKPDDNGISKITVSIGMPGVPAGPAKAAGGPVMLITQLGNYALVTSNDQYDKLVQYKKLMAPKSSASAEAAQLAGVSDSALAQQAAKEPIWIYGNIQTVSNAFGPLLFEKIEEIKTSITNMDSIMQESIEKLEETRNNLADTDKAKTDEIIRKIQKLKDQHSDLQARIGKLEQETSRLANIDPNEKAEVEKLQKQIETLREQKKLADNIQEAIEKLELVKDELQTELPAVTDQLDKQIQRMKDQQNRLSALQSQETIANVVDMYVGILETLMKETKSLTVVVSPSPEVLRITETVFAVPGTDMADMFTADATAGRENDLLGYLEDGAAMNFAVKMDSPFWKKLTVKSVDLMAMLGGADMSAEDMAKMRTLAADAVDALGGPMAGTFSIDTTDDTTAFGIKYVMAVKDVDKFNKMIDESVEMFNTTGIADFYKSMGLEVDYTLKRGAETYKGVSIDSARLLMNSTEPNSPSGQMIDAMYGSGIDYRWGVVDGLCVMAIADDVDPAVHELIDRVKAGGPKEICDEIKEALEMLPGAEKADFLATYNYVRFFKLIGAMMQGMEMGGPGVKMPQIDVPSKSNINIAGKIGDDKIVVDIAVPKQHLIELMSAFMMLQQQVQTQMNVTTTKTTLKTLHSAVIQFKMDTGRFPTEEEGLMALVKKPADATGWEPGGYLDTPYMPKDAWNRDFFYELDPASGKPFVIISYGADGKEGGEDLNKDLFSTDAD
ncbi:MAG: type II secretion system protein GspG [Planctomycetes bacterium]|nr:type II secretion system protein GspG [Planctomycetota bacterium]